MDVLLEDNHNWLAGRDCPGLDFDWPVLESQDSVWFLAEERRTSICTAVSSASRSRPIMRSLRETPTSRENGATSIGPIPRPPPAAGAPPAQPAAPTVTGAPITELQTDLRDIGYVVPVDGHYGYETRVAVKMFQQHFFAGSRRGLVHERDGRTVNLVTAEFIKRVR